MCVVNVCCVLCVNIDVCVVIFTEVMSSLTNLGHDFKRFSRGLQPVVDGEGVQLSSGKGHVLLSW